jgi:hypothetical protein
MDTPGTAHLSFQGRHVESLGEVGRSRPGMGLFSAAW